MTSKIEAKLISPVNNRDFGLADHKYRSFNCVVPAGTKREDLESPLLWVHVANQIREFDEVRVVAEDHSFVAKLICTFSLGTDCRMKVMSGVDLEVQDLVDMPNGKYEIKLHGAKKYVIRNAETGDIIKENLPTKVEAQRELDDYVKALAM